MQDIAILAYPGCMGTELFGLSDFLLVAGHVAAALAPGRHVPLRTRLVAARAGAVALAGGGVLQLPALRGRPDLLVVPGLEVGRFGQWDDKLAPLQAELALIRRRHAAGVPLASICIGSFLLAEAGLLQGRRAATAWVFEREFAQRYPGVTLERGALLCSDGTLTSTGAVSSVFDLGLRLAEQHYGPRIARAAARLALVGGRRASQRPFVDEVLLPPEQAAPFSAQVQRWLGARLAQRYELAALAAAFHTSTRTLLRRYRQETGSTPLAWLQQARVRQARRLLETSRKSLAQVVAEVGYEDVATFSRLFQRQVGESPARYRRHASMAR
ncbi:GlxA family transcriptional regulator [Aquabacterium sp.]|uniref:GlxA family transcriptional regulator n=1 Tax=Aquabacterium sp. TaxID=1872578 RepID=UPI0037834872